LTCLLKNVNEGATSFTLFDVAGRTVRVWRSTPNIRTLLNTNGIPSGAYRLVANLQSGDTLSAAVTIQR
jgi:hypothetical protein